MASANQGKVTLISLKLKLLRDQGDSLFGAVGDYVNKIIAAGDSWTQGEDNDVEYQGLSQMIDAAIVLLCNKCEELTGASVGVAEKHLSCQQQSMASETTAAASSTPATVRRQPAAPLASTATTSYRQSTESVQPADGAHVKPVLDRIAVIEEAMCSLRSRTEKVAEEQSGIDQQLKELLSKLSESDKKHSSRFKQVKQQISDLSDAQDAIEQEQKTRLHSLEKQLQKMSTAQNRQKAEIESHAELVEKLVHVPNLLESVKENVDALDDRIERRERESYERSQTSQGNHSNRNQGYSQRGSNFVFEEPSSVDRRQEGQNFHQQTSAMNTAQRNQGYGQRGSQFVYKGPGSSVDHRQEGQAFHQQTSAMNTAQRSRQNSESKDNSACNKMVSQSATTSHSRSDSSVKSPSSESPTKSHSLSDSEEMYTQASCLTSESSPPSDPIRKSMPATPMKSLSLSDTTQFDYEIKEKTNSPKESEKSGLSSAKRNKRSGSKDTVQGNVVPGLKDTKKFESQKSETVTGVWKVVPLNQLRRAPECYSEYASLQAAGNESADYQSDRPENQEPRGNKSAAVHSFVLLPHESPPEFGRNIRWESLTRILSSKINNYRDLENAIKTIAVYNPIQSRCHGQYNPNESVDCRTLQAYFKTLTNEQLNHFFQTTLPRMQRLALQLPYCFKEGLPILKQRINQEITLSQHQVACILASAFFNTFHERPRNYNAGKPLQMSDFNFINLYSQGESERKIEKLKCIINYFERVTQKMPEGYVTYKRLSCPSQSWKTMENKLTNLHVSTEGTIEDERGFLQADFANKFVGGGVLNTELGHEEIRFVLCPEMIVSRLIIEMLTDEEVLVMIGCERFNAYSGYSDSFKFTGNYVDETERDEMGRMYSEVVAMDASVFRNDFYEQFNMRHVLRELNKAYCAFKRVGASNLPAVCTGNWGCGAFGGDKQLKALIQWMAASAAGRDICYLTFGDAELCLQIGHMYDILKGRNMSIKDIMQILEEYSHSTTSDSVFKYMEDTIRGNVKRPEKSTGSDVSKPTNANNQEERIRSVVPKPTNAN